MLAAVLWVIYAGAAYPVWTLVFRLRYGFWPLAGKGGFPPQKLYDWMDFGLFLLVLTYTGWIVFGPRPGHPISVPAGVGAWALGAALRAWAVWALGRNWRIGQDEHDERAEFVASGPYRLMHHPINTALILVAIGQGLMTGIDGRAILLLGASVVYFVVQGRAEERAWKKRKGQCAERT